ncbi:predicted protein [Naegleria gruberi]|uniref:Predicted protein n=1 Tax=Naegleria gruberi TaxID=5762 RepID=D2VGM0_NAEGR|nr:uncharacterized protein NAEGRDRAFT_49376 [Naegleria gruberi]EFC44086.1 predicted protein [Naegleria gruberi]|eukprot:XP_002676830.1 predicted protein [Naegleria gruberi strain NEG-M]
MSQKALNTSVDFLSNLKKRVDQQENFDIGLLLSIGYKQEEEDQEILHHTISLISSLESEKAKSSFSNVSSEWFQKQVQILQQSLPSNVRISGFYLKDFSYNVKERLSDVIALYVRSIESIQSEEGSQIYFVNLQKDEASGLVPQGFVFENGKQRQDLTVSFTEKSAISSNSLKEYLCVLPYHVKLKVGKNIDSLIDELENTLEKSFEKNYIWKVNRKEKRVKCFLNTNIELQLEEKKVQDESELMEIVLSGVISGVVQTIESVKNSDEFIIELVKKNIIEGLVTRIAYEDEAILKASSKKLLRRFYIVDSESNLIYSDYCENVKSIGIVDAIPSLLSNSSQFEVIDSENIEGHINRISVDRDVIEVPEFIKKKKQAKKDQTLQQQDTSTPQQQDAFAWFFAFIAFVMSLLGLGKKEQVKQ